MAKYIVNIENIFSNQPKGELLQHKECIIGISMSNPIYWRSSLNDVLKWASQNFSTVHLVIGDFLNRFNEEILKRQGIKASEKSAVELGDKFMVRINKYLEEYPKPRFKIIRWADLLKDKQNKAQIKRIFKLYATNNAFKEMISTSASEYIEKQKKRGKTIYVSDEIAINLSACYLLEELAIFNNMISNGLRVIVYPGAQLSILTSMATGEFSEISDHLKDGIYVQLKVTKK